MSRRSSCGLEWRRTISVPAAAYRKATVLLCCAVLLPFLFPPPHRRCPGLQRFGLLLHRNPAGLVTLAAGYRFADHWIARFHWNRVAARDDRDADMFLLGVGYRWNR